MKQLAQKVAQATQGETDERLSACSDTGVEEAVFYAAPLGDQIEDMLWPTNEALHDAVRKPAEGFYLSCVLTRLMPSEEGLAQVNEDMDADERLKKPRDETG